jgi:hypothetical protein
VEEYFGSGCHIYGVDIEPACQFDESSEAGVFIGDQADPSFWKDFLKKVPRVDIVIDDGGHRTFQQVATLEALLPYIRLEAYWSRTVPFCPGWGAAASTPRGRAGSDGGRVGTQLLGQGWDIFRFRRRPQKRACGSTPNSRRSPRRASPSSRSTSSS